MVLVKKESRSANKGAFHRASSGFPFLILLLSFLFTFSSTSFSQNQTELGAEDDLTVLGTDGTVPDPDVEIKGFSVFGSTNVLTHISTAPGSVVINGALEVSSGVYVVGNSTFAGNVYFSTNVFVMNGKVGIGTAAPGTKLHVNGGNITVSGGDIDIADAGSKLYFSYDKYFYEDVATGEALVYRLNTGQGNPSFILEDQAGTDVFRFRLNGDSWLNGGSVGIGTAAPGARLEVKQSANDTYALKVSSNNGAGLAVVRTDGNVGISTGAPQARLDVLAAGSAQTDMAQLWRDSGGTIVSSVSATGIMMASKFVGNGSGLTGISGDNLGNHTATQDLALANRDIVGVSTITVSSITATAAGVTVSTNLFIMNGNVGIGTTAPGAKLEVAGGSSSFRGSDSNAAIAGFADAGGNYRVVIATGGQVLLSDGVKGAPGLSFGADTDTGLYRVGNEQLGISAAGVYAVLIDGSPGSGSATVNTQKLISHSSAVGGGSYGPMTAVEHSQGLSYSGTVNAVSNTGGDIVGAFHGAVNACNASKYCFSLIGMTMRNSLYDSNSPTALVQGDSIPGIGFAGRAPDFMTLGASILGVVDGAVGNLTMPTALVFNTSLTRSTGLTERLRITSGGNVGISTGAPQARLDVLAAGSAQTDMAQLWRDSGGTIVSSVSATGVIMASRFVGNGSGLTGISGSDNLGNHTATQDLALSNKDIVGVSTMTVSSITTTAAGVTFSTNVFVMNGGKVGIGLAAPAEILDIQNASFGSTPNIRLRGANSASLRLSATDAGVSPRPYKISADSSFRFIDENAGMDLLTLNGSTRRASFAGSIFADQGLDQFAKLRLTVFGVAADRHLIEFYTSANSNVAWQMGRNRGATGSDDFFIDQSGVNRFLIDPAGKVGISTNAPEARLDVKAAGSSPSDIAQIWRNSAGDIVSSMSATGLLTISSVTVSGNVAIGATTLSGDARLEVGGPLYVGSKTSYPGGVFIGAAGWPYSIGAQWNTDADDGALRFNPRGYQAGTTRFRDLIVYDGKENTLAFFDGSNRDATALPTSGSDAAFEVAGPVMVSADGFPGGLYFGSGGWPYSIGSGWNANADDHALRLNAVGYQAGTTRFRDLIVYDGKTNPVAFVDGSTGNVGLSTGAPQARLDVLAAGSAQTDMAQLWRDSGGTIVSSVSATGVIMASRFVGNGSGLTGISGSDNLGNHTATQNLAMSNKDIVGVSTITISSITTTAAGVTFSTNVFVMNGGNFGIGTAGPSRKLHVLGSSPQLLLEGATANGALSLKNNQGSSFDIGVGGTGSSYENKLYLWNAGGLNVAMTNTGSVGLGTTAPGARLEVAGGSMTVHGSDANPAIAGFTDAGGSYRVVIATGGNVGIGTTSPGASLDVLGNMQINSSSLTWAGWNNAINFPNTGHAALVYPSGGLLFGMHANTNFYWANTTAGAYTMMLGNTGNLTLGSSGFTFIAGNSGNSYFNAGNVGIGETAPGAKLSVSGGMAVGSLYDTTAVADGNVIISGNIGLSTGAPQARLDVLAAGSAQTDMAQLWRDSGGTIVSSVSATGVIMASRFVGNGSGLTGISGSDNLGNHTATQNLAMSNKDIVGVSTITISSITTTAAGVTFSTNVFVMNGGKVGIGTTGPIEKLHVYTVSGHSMVRIETAGADGTNAALKLTGGGVNADWNIGTNRSDIAGAAGNLFFNAASGTKMVLQNDGNVGIGTNSPTLGTLQVSGAGTAKIVLEHTSGPELELHSNDGNGLPGIRVPGGGTALSIQDSGNTVLARASGRVGVGTAIPGAKLEVAGGSLTIRGSDSDPAIAGFTDAAGNFKVVISTPGNVGIGTESPAAKLHISSPGQVWARMDHTNDSYGYFQLRKTAGVTANWNLGFNTGSPDLTITQNKPDDGGGTERVRITTSGYVGIGTTAPGARLDVRGSDTQAYNLAVGTSTAYSLVVSTNGNVGIWTTNPRYALEIASSTAIAIRPSPGEGYSNTIGAEAAGGTLRFGRTDGPGQLAIYAGAPSWDYVKVGANGAGITKAVYFGPDVYIYAQEGGTAGNVVFGRRAGDNVVLDNTYQFWGGNVGLSTGAPQARLDVLAAGSAQTDMAQLWRDSGGTIVSSVSATGVIMASRFVGNGSGITGLSGTDNLGNHTATQALNMSNKDIVGVSTITVSSITTTAAGVTFSTHVFVMNSFLGVGTRAPNSNLDIYNGGMTLTGTGITTGLTTIAPANVAYYARPISQIDGGVLIDGLSSDVTVPMMIRAVFGAIDPTDATVAMAFRAGKRSGTNGANLGDLETAYQWQKFDGTALATILGSGNLGIGTASPGAKLEVAGTIKLKTDGANTGELKVGYTGTAPAGYYATYAP